MGSRARWALLAVLLVAFGTGVVAAGQRDDGAAPLPGTERLGPEPGEPVAGYLDRAARSLSATGAGEAWALVQLNRHVQPDAAARLAQRVRLARVVLRVPLPQGLALAPLLPQQRRVAGPVPDDGPVP